MKTDPQIHASNHILAIPFPFYGHIFPMLQLCLKLASRGATITFVNTERNHLEVFQSLQKLPQRLGLDIRLQSIPDELPADFELRDYETFRQILHAVQNLSDALELLLEKLSIESPTRFSFILSDVHLGWTQNLAHKMQLRRVALWTSNASELACYVHAPSLISTGRLPFQDCKNQSSQSQSDTMFDIPGLPSLHREDFPSLLQLTDSSDILFTYFIEQTQCICEADFVLVNSIYDLESRVFDSLRQGIPNILPVGPLAFLTGEGSINYQSITGIRDGEDACIQWLDKQKTASVLYVSFGTSIRISVNQLVEFAVGLESTQLPFLWVVPPHFVTGGWDALPKGFLNRVKDHAQVVIWAPQFQVLSHNSIGGFWTHCGWNSTMESIYAGVPMLCWPRGADQILTHKLVVDEWRVGITLCQNDSGLVTREEVEEKVKMVMRGEKGKEVRRRARDTSEGVKGVVREGGSSYENLEFLLRKMTL